MDLSFDSLIILIDYRLQLHPLVPSRDKQANHPVCPRHLSQLEE